MQTVIAGTAIESVSPLTAMDHIVAALAEDGVITVAAKNEVAAIAAFQCFIGRVAEEVITLAGSDQPLDADQHVAACIAFSAGYTAQTHFHPRCR